MTPARLHRLREMYLSGVPWREIENEFDRSIISLNPLVRKMGLPRRNRYQTKWTEDGGYMRPWLFQRDELERLAMGGIEADKIAARLGRSYDGVRQECRKLGIVTQSRAERVCSAIEDWSGSVSSVPLIRLFDDAMIKEKEIAAMLEVRPPCLTRWRRRHSIPKPTLPKMAAKGRKVRKDSRSRMLPGYHDDHA